MAQNQICFSILVNSNVIWHPVVGAQIFIYVNCATCFACRGYNLNCFCFSFQALVGQPVTLPRVAKDEKRYTVFVETVSSERFPPPKRATSHFRADEYYKYLEITISKQVLHTHCNYTLIFDSPPPPPISRTWTFLTLKSSRLNTSPFML